MPVCLQVRERRRPLGTSSTRKASTSSNHSLLLQSSHIKEEMLGTFFGWGRTSVHFILASSLKIWPRLRFPFQIHLSDGNHGGFWPHAVVLATHTTRAGGSFNFFPVVAPHPEFHLSYPLFLAQIKYRNKVNRDLSTARAFAFSRNWIVMYDSFGHHSLLRWAVQLHHGKRNGGQQR